MLRLNAAACARGAGRPRVYYGWVLLCTLAVTETVSYGVLTYVFPVFLAPMQAELGWTQAQLTGAFSLAFLVMGLAGVPIGRHVDRHGARGVMTGGSLLAAVLLLAWSNVKSLAVFYAIWVGLGVAMAAVLYEPAFAVIAVWFRRLRARALTFLTFIAGFASVVFIPLASRLVEAHGWRTAVAILAAITAAITIPLHGILLRRRPEDIGLTVEGSTGECAPLPWSSGSAAAQLRTTSPDGGVDASAAGVVIRSASFRYLAAAFTLSSFATTAATVHLIPLLLERGFTAAFSATAAAAIGTLALPGRLIFTPLGGRWPRARVAAGIFLLGGVGLGALMMARSTAGVWTAVVLFGAGFGAITPARAALVAEWYGAGAYASINGALGLVLALARAAAPIGASLLYRVGGGYDVVLAALALTAFGAAIAILAAGRAARRGPAGAPESGRSETPA